MMSIVVQNFMTHSSDGWDDYDTMGYDASQDNQAVRGTCQEIEKSYFRLTSKPEPSAVRPEAVLERALHRLVSLEIQLTLMQDCRERYRRLH